MTAVLTTHMNKEPRQTAPHPECSNKSTSLSNNVKTYNTTPVIVGNLQLYLDKYGGVSLELPKRIEGKKL